MLYELLTGVPPLAPLADLPPWRTTLTIWAIVLGVLSALGILADMLRRNIDPLSNELHMHVLVALRRWWHRRVSSV